MNARSLVAIIGVASVVLMGPVARAADEWFMPGEQTIKAVDQGTLIKSQGGRWTKDVKQMRIGVEGANGFRTRESRRKVGSEGCSGTQGTAPGGDGRVQDRWYCPDGQAPDLGIRLRGRERRAAGWVAAANASQLR
jgi:hypothetical protein